MCVYNSFFCKKDFGQEVWYLSRIYSTQRMNIACTTMLAVMHAGCRRFEAATMPG